MAIGGVAIVSATALSLLGLPISGTVLVVGILYLPIVLTLVPEEEDRELLGRLEDRAGVDLSPVDRLMFERF